MSLYNPGDKVFVRADLKTDHNYRMYSEYGGVGINIAGQPMVDLAGTLVTIKAILPGCGHYLVEELRAWAWTDEMFLLPRNYLKETDSNLLLNIYQED